ncbi:uncharacterized protein LOC141601217 [Silene latifolia]|uniref:uncharacterized protein LOC141601217 n=1 Tax=Silene latifolia TaxID=37657 RepID=UPI003D780A82
MKFAVWNIRGLNDSLKQLEVGRLLSNNKIDVFGLVETHVKTHKEDGIMSQFPNYVVVSNNIQGRVWLFYNPSTVVINKVVLHEQLIHCEAWFKMSNQHIAITFVYGYNDPRARVGLWDKLSYISSTMVLAWVVLGDFNVVRRLNERAGPNPPANQDIIDFNACLANCYLDDIHSMGSEFTWTNKQDVGTRTWARLDRVLVNPDWLTMFPTSYATSLPPGVSDHSPLVVTVAPSIQVPRRFSFLNAWQDHPDYQSIVNDAWNTSSYGTPMFQLFHKLKQVRFSLQLLHKIDFTNISEKVQVLRGQLEQCQIALQTDLFSPELLGEEKNLVQRQYRSEQEGTGHSFPTC